MKRKTKKAKIPKTVSFARWRATQNAYAECWKDCELLQRDLNQTRAGIAPLQQEIEKFRNELAAMRARVGAEQRRAEMYAKDLSDRTTELQLARSDNRVMADNEEAANLELHRSIAANKRLSREITELETMLILAERREAEARRPLVVHRLKRTWRLPPLPWWLQVRLLRHYA